MMQEHPFFTRPLIFFGKPIEEDEEEEGFEDVDLWGLSLGRHLENNHDKIGLFLFWSESIDPDESNYS